MQQANSDLMSPKYWCGTCHPPQNNTIDNIKGPDLSGPWTTLKAKSLVAFVRDSFSKQPTYPRELELDETEMPNRANILDTLRHECPDIKVDTIVVQGPKIRFFVK